ncbi:hypothetical protein CLU96_2268 [Chryseobacterium sp. 52]|nr:hypothetical protein CLU96_2268 [Chryseobacterium sp. 52]
MGVHSKNASASLSMTDYKDTGSIRMVMLSEVEASISLIKNRSGTLNSSYNKVPKNIYSV